MGRSNRQTADYFPHYVGEKSRTKFILEKNWGNDGYAFWFMAYRYYSTLRPLMVGGIPFPKQPGESITTIVNFEEGRTYCKDIDRPAWGYIEYTAPLDPQQVSDYELVLAPEEGGHE